MELVRESFTFPHLQLMRWYLSYWAKEPSQSLWSHPLPGKQACGSLQGERASGHCTQAWTSQWKHWALHSTEQSSHSALPRSSVSSANLQPCPAFPECHPKPSCLLLPTARSSELGLGWVGVVLAQFWTAWLTGAQHWKYLLGRRPCRAHPMWRKLFLTESPKPRTKSAFLIF